MTGTKLELVEIFSVETFGVCCTFKFKCLQNQNNQIIYLFLALKEFQMALKSGEITAVHSSSHEVVNAHYKTFGENYRLIAREGKLLPVIHCIVCEKFWFLYKLYNNRVRSNPRSNIENHTCVEAANQPTLT